MSDTAPNPDRDRILNRIKKMLALANNQAASEGERDNAMRMAHATLAKHNIEMAEVEAAGEKPQERRGIVRRDFYGRPWARKCVQAIANMCFCEYIYTPGHRPKDTTHWFIGRESNATSAAYLSEFVVNSIWGEGHRRARAVGLGNEYARNFATGAATAVSIRCALLRKEAENPTPAQEKASPGTALVLASFYESEKQANQLIVQERLKPRETKVRSKATYLRDALNAGHAYGDKVSLQRSIEGKKQERLK